MIKLFRAWDGKEYWYSDKNLLFYKGNEFFYLHEASFELSDLEIFTGKTTSEGVKIFENDVIRNPFDNPNKLYQIIWDLTDAGFKKIPLRQTHPKTNIDVTFVEVLGTIHDKRFN